MFQETIHVPDTGDLLAVLRLTPMASSTRVGTVNSVRKLRDHLAPAGEMPVTVLAETVANPSADLVAALAPRSSQILSDCRRALRAWEDPTRRDLVLRLKGAMPMVSDALIAVKTSFQGDRCHRAIRALEEFVEGHGLHLDSTPAAGISLEPMLRDATPETFGVASRKSLDNKLGLIRSAVALVDPVTITGREADVQSLPPESRAVLATLLDATPETAKAEAAVFKRLLVTLDRRGLPIASAPSIFPEFLQIERATKSANHLEKLSRATRLWNATAGLPELPSPVGERQRLPSVKWTSVPELIRGRVDAVFDEIRSPHSLGAWSDLVIDPADKDLGLGDLMGSQQTTPPVERSEGTLKNHRDAVKRAWHAAFIDDAVGR